jgi:hypothetical protein
MEWLFFELPLVKGSDFFANRFSLDGLLHFGPAIETAGVVRQPFHFLHETDTTVTELGESEMHSFADGLAKPSQEVIALGPDDFRRIGIRPKESRLEVIRRAASRAAKSLARRQLRSPNPLTEQQLSRIAVSTYRLLDPRQREDRQARAHVGRIRPGALQQTGRASFADGRDLRHTRGTLELADPAAAFHTSKLGKSSVAERPSIEPLFDAKAESDTFFLLVNRRPSFLTRVRRQAQRPSTVVAMMVALLLSAVALWMWGQHSQSLHDRLVPVSAETQPGF